MRILIASEENAEMRENLKEYYSMAQKNPNFDEEKIVDDILAHNYSFLWSGLLRNKKHVCFVVIVQTTNITIVFIQETFMVIFNF